MTLVRHLFLWAASKGSFAGDAKQFEGSVKRFSSESCIVSHSGALILNLTKVRTSPRGLQDEGAWKRAARMYNL